MTRPGRGTATPSFHDRFRWGSHLPRSRAIQHGSASRRGYFTKGKGILTVFASVDRQDSLSRTLHSRRVVTHCLGGSPRDVTGSRSIVEKACAIETEAGEFPFHQRIRGAHSLLLRESVRTQFLILENHEPPKLGDQAKVQVFSGPNGQAARAGFSRARLKRAERPITGKNTPCVVSLGGYPLTQPSPADPSFPERQRSRSLPKGLSAPHSGLRACSPPPGRLKGRRTPS